ncbi:MAG: dipeptide epimerase [Pirellulaceae bacterium]|nr:dipeptide epimerase [Pirellulaceae bacterium]
MRITELTAFVIELPLRREIKHASASRTESQNILIRCRLEDGTEGWGEGVPRDYVTGETPHGAMQQLARTPIAQQLDQDCNDWQQVIALCDAFAPSTETPDPRGHHSNALRCAVELSILDAFGNLFNEPISRLTEHLRLACCNSDKKDFVRYSTTITAESAAKERRSAIMMRAYGFRQCKVKVGVQGANDFVRLKRIRFWLGPHIDIRLDANEAWPSECVQEKLEPLLSFRISCLEQPCAHAELEALAQYKSQIKVPVMLDESLTSLIDAERAVTLNACDMFNIRLSKCGGYLNSLRLAEYAHRHGIAIQLGCHPGETGILSAAGRHWATSVRAIRYLEGSYDRHLLRELPTVQDITFGYGGRAPALHRPGLGVTINPQVLNRIKTTEKRWRWG